MLLFYRWKLWLQLQRAFFHPKSDAILEFWLIRKEWRVSHEEKKTSSKYVRRLKTNAVTIFLNEMRPDDRPIFSTKFRRVLRLLLHTCICWRSHLFQWIACPQPKPIYIALSIFSFNVRALQSAIDWTNIYDFTRAAEHRFWFLRRLKDTKSFHVFIGSKSCKRLLIISSGGRNAVPFISFSGADCMREMHAIRVRAFACVCAWARERTCLSRRAKNTCARRCCKNHIGHCVACVWLWERVSILCFHLIYFWPGYEKWPNIFVRKARNRNEREMNERTKKKCGPRWMTSELNSGMNEQQRKKERFFAVGKYGRVLRLHVLNVASSDSQRSELVACAKKKTEKEKRKNCVMKAKKGSSGSSICRRW